MGLIEWIAYCKTCKCEILICANGKFVEAAAKTHIKNNKGHKVIVGYEPNTD